MIFKFLTCKTKQVRNTNHCIKIYPIKFEFNWKVSFEMEDFLYLDFEDLQFPLDQSPLRSKIKCSVAPVEYAPRL